jgi:RNA polymerase sigma-70 factor (ECF subfamily)
MRRTGSHEHDVRDAALWSHIQASDPTALRAIIEQYTTELRSFAMLVVRQEDMAQEVVQDVFVRLWERRTTLSIQGSLIAYLYRMTRNRALDMLKHERATQRLRTTIEREYVISGTPTALNEGTSNLLNEELRRALDQILRELQPQLREIFLMVRLHGMGYAEVADMLGISVVTVRSQMSRAVRRIGEALGHWE